MARFNQARDVQAGIKCEVQICKSKRRKVGEDHASSLCPCRNCLLCFSPQSACGSGSKLHFAPSLPPPDFAQDLFLPASPSSPSPHSIYTPIFQIDSPYFPPEPFSLIVSLWSPLQMLHLALSPSAASKILFAHICTVSIVKSAPCIRSIVLQAGSLGGMNLRIRAIN